MSSPVSLDTTYGIVLVGLVVAAVLYGVTLLQTYLYYVQYPKDPIGIKCLVLILWVLDTLHLILCTISLYGYLITNFSNFSALEKTTWSWNIQTDCNGLIGLLVEVFFARRVWKMSGNPYLTGIIVILACIHFGLGIVFTVKGFILVETSKFGELIWVTSAGLGSAAAADIIIAWALCYYLWKSRTGFARTDSLISSLMGYSLTTGLITSIIATISVICFAIMPTNYIWLGFFWVLGKCYVNSLLAALNSRDYLREKVIPKDGTAFQLSPFSRSSQHPGELTSRRLIHSEGDVDGELKHAQLAVNVHTTTVSKVDCVTSSSPTHGHARSKASIEYAV